MSFSKLVNSEYIPKHEVDSDNTLIDEGYNPQHLKIHNKSVDLQEIAKFRKKEKALQSVAGARVGRGRLSARSRADAAG